MTKKHKLSGAGVTMPVGIVMGVAVCVAVVLIGAVALAYLVIRETIGLGSVGFGALLIIGLSSAIGAWFATMLVKEKKLLVCGLTALGFYLVLLSITAVFFDGMYAGLGIAAVAILAGAGISLLPGMRGKKGKNKIKIPAYR